MHCILYDWTFCQKQVLPEGFPEVHSLFSYVYSIWSIKINSFLLILFTQYILAEYKFKYANCHHHLHCIRNEIYYFYHFLFVETKESLITPALEEQNNINQKQHSFTGSHLTTPEVSYQPWCKFYWTESFQRP